MEKAAAAIYEAEVSAGVPPWPAPPGKVIIEFGGSECCPHRDGRSERVSYSETIGEAKIEGTIPAMVCNVCGRTIATTNDHRAFIRQAAARYLSSPFGRAHAAPGLQYARASLGLSERCMAGQLGMSENSWRLIETGASATPIAEALAVVALLLRGDVPTLKMILPETP